MVKIFSAEWVKRLNVLIGEQTQKDFAAWVGISPARLNNYLQGRHEYPEADFLVALAQKQINVNWLLTGEGGVYSNPLKPYPITEEMQILVKEVSDTPALVPRLTDFIRNVKQTKKAEDDTKAVLEQLKEAMGQKKKKR